MRVLCLLDEVLSDSPVKDAELEARLGIEIRTIKKLRRNARDWRLDAKQFRNLMLFGFERGLDHGIFAIQPHPIWRTFVQPRGETDKRAARIFRAARGADSEVELALSGFLQRAGCVSTTVTIDPQRAPNADEIREAMLSQNCIFVGSPKSNAASEIALCLLWDAKPFQSGPSRQDKLPFRMLMPDADKHGASSFIVPGGRQHGFAIPDGTRAAAPHMINVSWAPLAEYRSSTVDGQDAAMVVVVKSPLGTTKDVTTIVIAGYTGRATRVTTQQLIMGEPPVAENALTNGKMHLLAYRFAYRKPKRPASSDELRQEVQDSGTWGPPWNAVSDT
jgi:hypothetical protein